jgi:signal peptidase
VAAASSVPAVALATAGPGVLRSLGRGLLDAILLLGLSFFLFLAVGPHLLPYRTVTMLSGSMSPYIPVGSLAVDTPEPVSALHAGQVVSFHAPIDGHPVVTHRVVSVEHRDGQVLIRTRGDANSGVDPWLAVVHGRTVWRVSAVVPAMGGVVRTLRGGVVHLVIAWLLPFVLLVALLWSIWRPRRDTTAATAHVPYPRAPKEGESACADASGSPRSSPAAAV